MPRPAAIHRTAIVAPEVEIGEGTVIGPYAVVVAPCRIGDDCWIGPHAVVGTTAEHVGEMVVQTVASEGPAPTDEEMWFGRHGRGVQIGSRTILRERCTVHSGTAGPTVIGDDVFMMNTSHVAHDGVLGDRVRMASYSTLGGHVTIGDDANIGLAAAVHQWRVVGAGAMVGMQAAVVKDVAPYQLVKGVPAAPGGVNAVWLERAGYSAADIAGLTRFYEGEADALPAAFADALALWEASRRA
ncbi:hypothetical protein [Rhabdothermincola salaria]|uniref:hypothetical protein n=1 Tax=Rhabdothermincola salaria TaxID=2903142 RepID=UPI001E524D9A|nr:hypothetical protein [Rhabdothermincola salaria]MCD9623373.1 hypothetical protein [Rhabdothermincola salaria]